MSAPGQRPVHVPADGGESVFLGDTYTTLLSGAQTGGVFTLLEALVLPEAGPHPMPTTARKRHSSCSRGTWSLPSAARRTPPRRRDLRAQECRAQLPERGRGLLSQDVVHVLLAGMEAMFPAEIGGKPGRRGVVGPPLDPADLAAIAGVAEKYNFFTHRL